jgi:hypothetical protein
MAERRGLFNEDDMRQSIFDSDLFWLAVFVGFVVAFVIAALLPPGW